MRPRTTALNVLCLIKYVGYTVYTIYKLMQPLRIFERVTKLKPQPVFLNKYKFNIATEIRYIYMEKIALKKNNR